MEKVALSKHKAIILMGIKHCGKSTQGRLLSQYLDCPFYDTDDLITARTGKTPRALYVQDGVSAFMQAEAEACQQLATIVGSEEYTGCVIATGGGICNNQAAIDILSRIGVCIFLRADEKLAADRIVREAHVTADGTLQNLPAYIAKENPQSLDDVRAAFHRFYEDRVAVYKKICSVSVVMQPVPAEQNMHRIISAVSEA